jgi:hypothetical protein
MKAARRAMLRDAAPMVVWAHAQADDRFFWNRYLVEPLIAKSDKDGGAGVRRASPGPAL